MTVKDLDPSEFNPYYNAYIDLIPKELELLEGFHLGLKNVTDFFNSISKEKLTYKYAENKWTVLEILQHIIDTERIFMYRCLRMARHDKTPLAGFDENDYINPSLANNKSIELLLEEYRAGRQNFIVLLKSISETELKFIGMANGSALPEGAAAFIILGHELWHTKIIKERYL